MSNQFKLCNSCVQRHCNKRPVIEKGAAFGKYTCMKYRKHATGFKLEDLMHGKEKQTCRLLD